MKKIIALIFVLGLFILNFAQEPVSIRSNSLANIIDDNWDLIYDPIELGFIEGTYFFTNLADFNTCYRDNNGDWEEQNESFLTELPLGLSFQNPLKENFKHSFLLRLRESKESEHVYGGSGEHEEMSAHYYDVDGDGLYDMKQLQTKKYTNYDISKRLGFVFNNSFIFGSTTLGFKFSYDKQNNEDDEAKSDMGIWNFGGYLDGVELGDYGFEETTTNYLLVDEYSDYDFSEEGDFLTKTENSHIKYNFAIMRKFTISAKETEFRLDFMHQRLVTGKVETDDDYSGNYTEITESDSLSNYVVKTGNITDAYTMSQDESGNKSQMELSIKTVFDKRVERKNDGFWKLGIVYGLTSGDYDFADDRQLATEQNMDYASTSNTDFIQEVSNHQYTNDIGDYKGSNFIFYGKFNIPYDEIINFGFGTFCDYRVVERETDYIEDEINISEYTEGSSFNDENDYIITETSKLTADRTFEKQIYQMRIPVGLEFRMPKKDLTDFDTFGLRNFSFRIGTTYFYTKTIINDIKQVTDSCPLTTITEYGDGEVEINIDDNYYRSTSDHTEDIVGMKRFSGGIGYHHSENLQIDIGGYIDDNWKNSLIGISFSIKL
ncbi:MAG: hypothetical protein Q7J16_00525 [Candidatus Cloacimonadales bacterium]|nr:hypothetical protein [Candidatus Cloacimonadales bacterium]